MLNALARASAVLGLTAATLVGTLVFDSAPAHADDEPYEFGGYVEGDSILDNMKGVLDFITVGLGTAGFEYNCLTDENTPGIEVTGSADPLTGLTPTSCQELSMMLAPSPTRSLIAPGVTSTALSQASGVRVSAADAGLLGPVAPGEVPPAPLAPSLNSGSALRATMFGLAGETMLEVDEASTDLPKAGAVPGSPSLNLAGMTSWERTFDGSNRWGIRVHCDGPTNIASTSMRFNFYNAGSNAWSYQGKTVSCVSPSQGGSGQWYADNVYPSTYVLKSVTVGGADYYPPNSPDFTTGTQGSLTGVFETIVQCMAGLGQGLTLSEITPVVEGRATLPSMTCPQGMVAGGYSSTYQPSTGDPVEVFAGENPEWITSAPDEMPGCINGGCELSLWQVSSGSPALFCGQAAVGCPQWWQTVQTNPDAYQCRYGTYTVDLSYCAAFREPGSLMPTYPVTFAPDGTPTVGTRVGTVTDADYAQLDAIARATEELVRIARENPDPNPTPTAPDNPTPTTAPVPPPIPNVAESRNCWPTGWGIFNPFEWVYLPVTCALEWAFVPSSESVAASLATGQQALAEHGMLSVIPAAAAVPSQLEGGFTSGCTGDLAAFNAETAYGGLEADLPCSPQEAGFAQYSAVYNLLTLVIVTGGAWGVFIVIRQYFGGKGGEGDSA